jgi:hypothetical protein
MVRRKTSKRQIKLTIVSPPDAHSGHLQTEADDELRELIRSINQKSKRKKRREGQKPSEHDPNLPPAA